jgi:hypothetical protein
MNILEISNKVATALEIDALILENIIRTKLQEDEEQLTKLIDNEKIEQFNKLLDTDNKIKTFEIKYINNTHENTKKSFNSLKTNLGKLQVLVLLKELEKSKNCDQVLNGLFTILNNKISGINDIISNNTIQNGGGNNYLKKYLKYKIKYFIIKKKNYQL